VKDLCSIALNLILYKLTFQIGLETKMMMSMNGLNIFILVRGNDYVLKQLAESSRY